MDSSKDALLKADKNAQDIDEKGEVARKMRELAERTHKDK